MPKLSIDMPSESRLAKDRTGWSIKKLVRTVADRRPDVRVAGHCDAGRRGPWITVPASRAEYDALAARNRQATERCRSADPKYFDDRAA